LFTAPLAPESCQVTATATDGSGSTASTDVTVTSPINITPSSVNLHALNTLSFSASQAVTWSASCGSISSAGAYAAPATEGNCTITATATGSPAYTAQASADIDVVNQLRWRNNQGGTGLQAHELQLTPANVNSSSFGQVWSAAVDGGVWAQPLYMNGLQVNGAPHNVLFVATDNDSVYALDADTGEQLWQVSLLPAGATAVVGTMVDDQYIPSIGVLGTPAIDNGVLYVVAETAEQNATYFPHRLHALDVATGNEKFGGPVLVSDPNLQPAHKLQRPGLTIANGTVYVAMGSLGDKQPYHGLLFAFDENTLAQTGVWNTTPTGNSGGIWQAGGAPSIDNAGNVYLVTGNGFSDGVNNFGESAVKLSPSLQVQDFFSPYNAAALTASDLDLGSASVPVMPDQNGQFPHVLIFCGKSPVIYVVNRDSMGHMGSSSDNILQELTNVVGGTATTRDSGQACFTSPSAWGENVYFIANGDVLKQFTLNASTGMLSATPLHQGTFAYGWPGSQSMVSSNQDENGIIWTFDNVGKTLHADNAGDVSQSLYVSPAINTGYLKWTTPMVINGRVYVGGNKTVVAFSTH
jgi:outer membrane protein assembly factor BamB